MPLLDDPLGCRPHTVVHGLKDGLVALGVSSAGDGAALVEGVHAVVAAASHYVGQTLVVLAGLFGKVLAAGVQDVRPLEPAP